MILSQQQNEALKIMETNFLHKEPITVITGYAGSGKSTIIKHFVEESDLVKHTKFVTYTGKASLVLRKKGLPAQTIHSLIYRLVKNKQNKTSYFVRKKKLPASIKLLVVDEISMVSNKILEDLLSFNIPIIALGDPGQLEPVNGSNSFILSPDYFIEEIHRQSKDNSIIRLSMDAREGRPLFIDDNDPNVRIVPREEVSLPMLQWADQVLCGRNKTRISINQEYREGLGYTSKFPENNEKLICLTNYWKILNNNNEPLINGAIGSCNCVEHFYSLSDERDVLRMNFEVDYSNEPWRDIIVEPNTFINEPIEDEEERTTLDFDYGYAITVHKAQGSEFDKIILFEENLAGTNHQRWLYTGITRATDKLIIVKE